MAITRTRRKFLVRVRERHESFAGASLLNAKSPGSPVGRHGNSSARPGVGTLDTRRRRRRRPNPKGAERNTPGRPAGRQLVQIPRDSNFRSRFTRSTRGFVRAAMETERQFHKFGLLRATWLPAQRETRSIALPTRTLNSSVDDPWQQVAACPRPSLRHTALSKSSRFRSSKDRERSSTCERGGDASETRR